MIWPPVSAARRAVSRSLLGSSDTAGNLPRTRKAPVGADVSVHWGRPVGLESSLVDSGRFVPVALSVAVRSGKASIQGDPREGAGIWAAPGAGPGGSGFLTGPSIGPAR